MEPLLPKSLTRPLHLILLLAAFALLALHPLHLAADFPNHSPWMDWSKYTDEGWYGDAAIRHFQLGRWYVEGDFNPAAALPVWPFLEAIVFRFTGVSLVAARALTLVVFAGICITSWLLMRRASPLRAVHRTPLAASVAVLLLAASPFCFVFTRLAILEPLLVLLTLSALLVTTYIKPVNPPGIRAVEILRANLLPVLALGLLMPLMILTKTTALFLLPAVVWMLFAFTGYRVRALLTLGVPAAGLAVLLWLGYFLLLVRPHFLLDYRYLFSANAYTGITLQNALSVLTETVKDGMWMGNRMYPLAVVAILVACATAALRPRRLIARPLIPALLLWAGGYAAFLAYHDNLQPRYYLVIAVPLTLLLPTVMEDLVLAQLRRPRFVAPSLLAAAAMLLAILIPDLRETVHYIRHPEYTLLNAARQVHDYIEQDHAHDPAHNPLLLSISGSDLSLMTGLHSIDDDFGTLELADRVKLYRPGWYAAWNQIDDDKMDALTPLFHIERVAAFPAMDDLDRNLLILYRLDDTVHTPLHRRPGKPTPRALRTKVGQQPSTNQLVH